ncbi:unnamed protein product [Rhizophagus irregularis]|nr:unnamed protein product [Rhizophagus irregularis]
MKEKHAPHFSTVTEISANQVRPNNETSLERNEERAVLPDIISLYETAQTQKALRIDDLFEKIGMDKLQYIKTYSADTISKFSNSQILTIIDHFIEKPNTEFTDNPVDEKQDDEVPERPDQNNVLEVLFPKE